MIGIQLTKYLLEYGANVTIVSLDSGIKFKKVKFIKTDLRNISNCLNVCKNIDYVFHLAGVKGSPLMAKEKPYSFMTPMLMFNTNILHAASVSGVKNFLYTSSVGVYNQKGIMKEEDVWKTFPQKMIGMLVGQKNWRLSVEALTKNKSNENDCCQTSKCFWPI